MPTYSTSQGERVSKSTIDFRVRVAKKLKIQQFIDEHDFVSCEECGVSAGVRIDCSHTESVKTSQDNGRCEMSWDVSNIRLLCRSCHQIHDKLH